MLTATLYKRGFQPPAIKLCSKHPPKAPLRLYPAKQSWSLGCVHTYGAMRHKKCLPGVCCVSCGIAGDRLKNLLYTDSTSTAVVSISVGFLRVDLPSKKMYGYIESAHKFRYRESSFVPLKRDHIEETLRCVTGEHSVAMVPL